MLEGRCSVPMQPGDVFVIATPSGGGFGKAADLKQAAE
jgi:N-methylhydantoinase B/oxoprolinase/acetone carboxylase alpha subunit